MYLNSVREEDLVFGMLGDFGALARHPAVGKLQRFLNDWADRGAGYGKLEVDEEYGGCTHATVKRFASWYASNPNATLVYSASQVDMGPMMYMQFLNVPPYGGFSASEMAELQKAFKEWDDAGRPGCGESTIPGVGTDILPEPGTPGSGGGGGAPEVGTEEVIAPLTRKAGMGALGWFLVVIGVGGAAYGVYRYSQRPKALPPRKNVRSHVNRRLAA